MGASQEKLKSVLALRDCPEQSLRSDSCIAWRVRGAYPTSYSPHFDECVYLGVLAEIGADKLCID